MPCLGCSRRGNNSFNKGYAPSFFGPIPPARERSRTRDEQKRSGFRYQYSNYQIEYSRNLVFEVGGHMDQVFQALIDRSRAALDLKTIKTILGYRHRPIYRCEPSGRPNGKSRSRDLPMI